MAVEPGPLVRAAGGIVLRDDGGKPEVLLVHRPAYDDWSLPKGKAEPGEPDEACALREVEEETGLRCRIVGDAGETRYRDGKGRPKVVRYFVMQPVEGEPAPHREVDAVRFVSVDEARALLTYERDRELLRAARGGRRS
jgi:8-oxo-dGTP diphosphatase